jgi:aldo/keto reductase family protein
VPFFPLGGFSPLQSAVLDAAVSLQATPMQVALAWLLHRAPNMLLIPGTSSVAHLRENLTPSSLKFKNTISSSCRFALWSAVIVQNLFDFILANAGARPSNHINISSGGVRCARLL